MNANRDPISRLALLVVSLPLLLSCSDSGTGLKKELEPIVGVWEATVLTFPDPANPGEPIDLMIQGASYALSVLATGQYSAVYDLVLVQGFESGRIEVSGEQLTLTPTSGTVTSGSWSLEGGILEVDALKAIDFDLDGDDDIVPIHIELARRES